MLILRELRSVRTKNLSLSSQIHLLFCGKLSSGLHERFFALALPSFNDILWYLTLLTLLKQNHHGLIREYTQLSLTGKKKIIHLQGQSISFLKVAGGNKELLQKNLIMVGYVS